MSHLWSAATSIHGGQTMIQRPSGETLWVGITFTILVLVAIVLIVVYT